MPGTRRSKPWLRASDPSFRFGGLVLLLGFCLAPNCGPSAAVAVHSPRADEIFVTGTVEVDATAGRQLALDTLNVSLEGVDLVAELGLTPPFSDESGVVLVGADPIVVTGFTIETPAQGPHVVVASLAGLPLGRFILDVSGEVPASMIVTTRSLDFVVVEALTLEAIDLPAAGLPGGAVPLQAGGTLGNASLGQALAAPPIATLGGQTLRSGHIEVAEELIAEGGS